jgi:hypothetical protein
MLARMQGKKEPSYAVGGKQLLVESNMEASLKTTHRSAI